MQPPGYFVPAAAELTTRVQDRHYHFKGRFILGWMDIDWDPAPVVDDADTAIRMNDHLDLITDARQSFIDRVIDNFIDQVMECLNIGAAHIHTRAAAHGFQTLHDLYIFCFIRKRIRYFRHIYLPTR